MIEDESGSLIFGNYEYKEGILELNNNGTSVEFEVTDGGMDHRVSYQYIIGDE